MLQNGEELGMEKSGSISSSTKQTLIDIPAISIDVANEPTKERAIAKPLPDRISWARR
jgi:hypothetical protein